ncbi:hypothetical protein L6J37_13230 [Photobacterium sp. WH77]|uniref:hypothetical protein n=1 Tax=unclassified Photobacterium TaxID=2628852 RepID=UPI001C45C10E|nr:MULTISPECIES: hypothetical protein [unclassified Photobacterium]MBV7262665.1 hypothetical protein [Photobacterium sp. WH24]MCG2837794.1 hypothetical protein [Photobacterium sp. WH77]MCG2845410.1 hypothetical protein [Photobacterium sp. WH80]MDO6582192.1 hypothetical protein [Photobacterium sp. 2_MG-2023]
MLGESVLMMTVLFSLVPILLGGYIGTIVDKLPVEKVMAVSTFIVLLFVSLFDLSIYMLFIMTLLISTLSVIVNIGCIKLCKIHFGSKGIYTLAFVVSFTGMSAPLLFSVKEKYSLDSGAIVMTCLLVMFILSLFVLLKKRVLSEDITEQAINSDSKISIPKLALINTIVGSYMYVYVAFFFLFIPSLFTKSSSLEEIGFLMSLYGIGVVSIRLIISKTKISLTNSYYLMGVGKLCSLISLICFFSLLYFHYESYVFGFSSLMMGIGTGLMLPTSIVINQNLTSNLNSGKNMGKFTQINKLFELIGVSLIVLTYALTGSWLNTLLLFVFMSLIVGAIYFIPFQSVRTAIIR